MFGRTSISLVVFVMTGIAFAQSPSFVNRESHQRPAATSGALSGSTELRWDYAEPTGFMAVLAGDTMCVTFPGVPGGRIDSIRVGLRWSGPITGGVWSVGHTGSPLGIPIAVPILATGHNEPGVPYPVPWPNWAAVDLTSRHIPSDSSFAVAFVAQGYAFTGQRVMVTEYVGLFPHSFTFLSAPGGGKPPGWYSIPVGQSGDTTYPYLIRAYVSTLTAINGRGTPAAQSFALEQNFPNPFNPSTVFSYTLQAKSHVSLIVYDIVGREVVRLVETTLEPGRYHLQWDARGVSSGAYLARLEAVEDGGKIYVQTRKAVVIR